MQNVRTRLSDGTIHDTIRAAHTSERNMSRMIQVASGVLLLGAMILLIDGRFSRPAVARADAAKPAENDRQAQIEQLQAQIKRLEGLVPDQAAVMTKVGYHFTNLYVAIARENWALADFYLGEAQNNIDWAVRAKPVRKDSQGRDIDLAGIA